jgi:GT2 family glycosyltransferase
MMESPLISVVLLSHNRFELLRQSLVSLLAQTYRPIEIILVDNRSEQSGQIRAWAAAEHPGVALIENENNGYTGGMNRGLREARGEYVEFHTDDIVHQTDYFQQVVAALPALGNWGAVNGIVYEGRESRIIRYCGGDIHFGVDYYLRIRGLGETDHGQYRSPLPTQFSAGANLFMPTALARAMGGFDNDYFMYFEDIDLSLRLAAGGYRSWVVPSARCHHLGHAIGTVTEAGQRYLERNLAQLYRKRGGGLKYAAHRLFLAIRRTRRAAP